MQENRILNAAGTAGAGGLLAWLSKLDLSTASYVVGISVAVLGLLISFYFQWRKDRRDAEIHDATLKALEKKGVNIDGSDE